jgi:hypothetical protein
LQTSKQIWTSKPKVAKRLRGKIEKVLDFAKAASWGVHSSGQVSY